MDLQLYLDSGILESYVLGLTSPEETREVEALALQHPLIRTELDRIQASLEEYAQRFSQTPPPHLRQQVLAAAFENEAEGDTHSQMQPTESPVRELPPPAPANPIYNGFRPLALAASYALLALSLVANFWLYFRWQRSSDELASLRTQNTQLAQSTETMRTRYTQASQELVVLKDPATTVVYLKGSAQAPQAMVAVYWHTTGQKVHVAVHNLPPLAPDQQYQLWAIVDGKPVDAGMLEMGSQETNLQKMKDIGQADAFAITLEKKGGNPTPQGQLFAQGEV